MARGTRNTPTTPADIARATYLAYVDKDRAAIEALIDDDFRFTSPLDNRIDRATYFERCWPNHERIVGFDFVRLIAAGDQVVVTYEGRKSDGGGFRNTEILTIRDGRVAEAEVYFGWNLPHDASEGRFIASPG
jgi:ketosteroid isomerase-like protein